MPSSGGGSPCFRPVVGCVMVVEGMGVGAVREAACMPQGELEAVGERGEIESQ